MTYHELSARAKSLREAKRFDEAIESYRLLFKEYEEECNQFDFWGLARCLQKTGAHQECLEVSRNGLKKFRQSAYLRNTYSWSIYHLYIRKEPVTDRVQFFRAAEAIASFSDAEDEYSPYVLTVFQVIDLLEENYDKQVQEILKWIRKLRPEHLDTDPEQFKAADGKLITLPSELEKYYLILTKALYESGDYISCVAEAGKALGAIPRFQNQGDLWIIRSRALSQFRLGEYNEAAEGLLRVLAVKREWYIVKELAAVYEAAGMFDKAMEYAIEADKARVSPVMKLNLFQLMARLYAKQGKNREAWLYAVYINLIRQDNQWDADAEAEKLIGAMMPGEPVPATIKEVERTLSQLRKARQADENRIRGVISRLLPNGKSGFIKAFDGKSYYFAMRDLRDGSGGMPAEGQPVNFVVVDSFDKSKNKATVKASDIRNEQ